MTHSVSNSISGDGAVRRDTIKEQKTEEVEIQSIWELRALFVPSFLLWLSRFAFLLFIFHCFTNISPVVLIWIIYSFLSTNYTNVAKSAKFFAPAFMIIQLIYYIQNIPKLIPRSILDSNNDWKHWVFFYDILILDLVLMLLEAIPITLVLYYSDWIGEVIDQRQLRNAIYRYLNQKNCPYLLRYFFALIQYWEIFTIFAIYILGVIHNDLYHISLMFVFVFFALYPESFRKNFKRLLIYVSFFVTMRYLYTINADYLNNGCTFDDKCIDDCDVPKDCLIPEIMIDIGIGVHDKKREFEDTRSI